VKLANFFLKALSACNTRVTQACLDPKPKRQLPVQDRGNQEWAALVLARSCPYPQVRTADGLKKRDATTFLVAVAAVQGLHGLACHLVNGKHLVLDEPSQACEDVPRRWVARASAGRDPSPVPGHHRGSAKPGEGVALREDTAKPSTQAGRRKAARAEDTHLPLQEQGSAVILGSPGVTTRSSCALWLSTCYTCCSSPASPWWTPRPGPSCLTSWPSLSRPCPFFSTSLQAPVILLQPLADVLLQLLRRQVHSQLNTYLLLCPCNAG